MKKLTLNQNVILEKIAYKIIGIDHYSLKNLFGKTKEWDSYTLIDDQGNKTWVSYGAVKDYFLQWTLISELQFKKTIDQSPNLDLTGIANVTFIGNPGYSTPTAEIVWFDLWGKEYDYVASERFLKQNGEMIEPLETYYDAGKILKDFKF